MFMPRQIHSFLEKIKSSQEKISHLRAKPHEKATFIIHNEKAGMFFCYTDYQHSWTRISFILLVQLSNSFLLRNHGE
jgi:hypothetical protein